MAAGPIFVPSSEESLNGDALTDMAEVPVTVIIPTYNCGNLVTEAIDSVLAQSTVPSQIIVVDDGSIDGTSERLVRYGDRIQYICQPNQGVSSARNRGIAEAGNQIIAFLDADDIWHPRKIEVQLDALSRYPELGLLGTNGFHLPVAKIPEVPMKASWPVRFVSLRQLVVAGHYFAISTVMIRRQVLADIGGFDPELRRAEDRDLYIRVARDYPVASLELPLTGRRALASSLSRQVATMRQDGEKLLRKLWVERTGGIDKLLLLQAASYLDYNCSNICEAAGLRCKALLYLLKSMALYPLPFQREATRISFERPKRLLILLWRLLTQQPPEFDVALAHNGPAPSKQI
jgi:glycosyltransferase involved in cell wall biosynthesis